MIILLNQGCFKLTNHQQVHQFFISLKLYVKLQLKGIPQLWSSSKSNSLEQLNNIVKLIMSTYNQILRQFQENFNYAELQKYELAQLSKKLDELAQINCAALSFDPIIKEEIIELVPVTYDKKIILKDFVNTIQKVFDILCKFIIETEKNMEASTDSEDIAVHRQNIEQFTGDRQYLCNVFRLPIRAQSKILKKMQEEVQSQFQQSQTLKAALIILLIAIPLQLVLMLTRFTFLNCFVYVLALGVFVLQFFDRSYVRICILSFFLSFVFDLTWCLSISHLYLNSVQADFNIKFGSLTQMKIGMLRLSFLVTLILMVAKLMLAVIFFRFRNNSIYTKKLVKLGDFKIFLDGKPFVSPISRMVMKNHNSQDVQCL